MKITALGPCWRYPLSLYSIQRDRVDPKHFFLCLSLQTDIYSTTVAHFPGARYYPTGELDTATIYILFKKRTGLQPPTTAGLVHHNGKVGLNKDIFISFPKQISLAQRRQVHS